VLAAVDVITLYQGGRACVCMVEYAIKKESELEQVIIYSILDTEHVFGVMCTGSYVDVGGKPGGF